MAPALLVTMSLGVVNWNSSPMRFEWPAQDHRDVRGFDLAVLAERMRPDEVCGGYDDVDSVVRSSLARAALVMGVPESGERQGLGGEPSSETSA